MSHAPSETSSFAYLCRIGLGRRTSSDRYHATRTIQGKTQVFWGLLVDGDVGGEVLGDGIDLAGGMAEVLVPDVPEFPVLRLVVLDSSASQNMMDVEESAVYRNACSYWHSVIHA
jgi:hypothetical protein